MTNNMRKEPQTLEVLQNHLLCVRAAYLTDADVLPSMYLAKEVVLFIWNIIGGR